MREVQEEIVRSLRDAAMGYGNAGLALLEGRNSIGANRQAAIGNLAIAVELLLKCWIANTHLLLLFRDVPLQVKCALTAPETIPSVARLAPHVVDLRSCAFRTVEFREAVGLVPLLSPELARRLGAHLRFLVENRNTCVHSALPSFRGYEAQRAAFVFLSLFKHVQQHEPDLLRYCRLGDEEADNAFLARFEEERIARVHRAIEAAQAKAKKVEIPNSMSVDSWEATVISCPVCRSDAVLLGDTQPDGEVDEDGSLLPGLTFVGVAFECEACDLQLKDYDELVIAGVDPVIDRSSELDRWYAQTYEDWAYEEWHDR